MTSLHEIYDMFLSNVSDYKLLAFAKQDRDKGTSLLDNTLFGYYKHARARFEQRCKNSLEVNVEKTLILSELTYYEIEIIVSIMMVAHIRPQLLSSENLKQSLSDKDFKIYSQANQLREIRLLLGSLESKVEKMITKYTFMDLGKEKK